MRFLKEEFNDIRKILNNLGIKLIFGPPYLCQNKSVLLFFSYGSVQPNSKVISE